MRKYAKQYEVPNVNPQTSSKEDLSAAVTKHWNAWVRQGRGCNTGADLMCSCRQLRPTSMPPVAMWVQAITEESVLQNLLRVRGRH